MSQAFADVVLAGWGRCRGVHLARGAVVALAVATAGAGGADDNHATALAAVLGAGVHFVMSFVWVVCLCDREYVCGVSKSSTTDGAKVR